MNLIQDICGQCFNITGYMALSCIEKIISTGSQCLATFCLSLNCVTWMSLNYKKKKKQISHVWKFKRYLCLRPFNAFSFSESSILTIKYVFSFFWSLNFTSLVCKLYISIRFILDFWAVLILENFFSCIF